MNDNKSAQSNRICTEGDNSFMKPIFIPFRSVGDFVLNSHIDKYINLFDFDIYKKHNSSFEIINYAIYNPEITLFLDSKSLLIESIACYEEILFKGINIIGKTIDEFMSYTGEKYYGKIDELDFEDDGISQFVYEFDDIGLQIWVKGVEGKIVTAIASGKE